MNCFSCSKNLKQGIKCDKCISKFCSESCLAFHYIFYHNEEQNIIKDNDFNNSNEVIDLSINQSHNSPYITKGFFVKEIKYESIFDIKNFQHQLVNGKPKLLGYGSFGKVFLEINKINKKFYAIKHIEKKAIYKALKTLDPIYSEIQIQSKISHPNIVKILYATENERYFDIVLEYAKKGNLFYYIQKNKHLSESDSFKIFIQIVNAIYFLHNNNYIHRDIKPENILLFEDNVAKLCDFGWCVEFKDEPRNTFCGTTEYMAPEMINQKRYGKEIDIWSLGILLYEMLHGHSPFKPSKPNFNDRDVINNIRFQKSIKYSDKLSEACIELLNHLIDKNIKRRYTLDDILNSKFLKNFEKIGFFIPQKNRIEFEKIDPSIRSTNKERIHYTNNYLSEKSNNDKLSNMHWINTSKYNSNVNLNSILIHDNINTKENINSSENNNNCMNIPRIRRINTTKMQNNFFYNAISPPKDKQLNPKFSSPKVTKINKNRLQKEDDFENENLSSIFNDDSIFNNNKIILPRNNRKYSNLATPTININILLNEINFSTINNHNYEHKLLKKIFCNENDNNSKNCRNTIDTIGKNINNMKIRENNFIKKQINIFTKKNCDINNINELKSNNTTKNIPVSIRNKNCNISNNSKINEMKIKKLINYFGPNNIKSETEREKTKKNSVSYSKTFNINRNKENINVDKDTTNKIEKENSKDINSSLEIIKNSSNENQEIKNNFNDLLIKNKNYETNLNIFQDEENIIHSELNLKDLEIVKTPKKCEDKFQIPIKTIFSHLKEELDTFNKKAKF